MPEKPRLRDQVTCKVTQVGNKGGILAPDWWCSDLVSFPLAICLCCWTPLRFIKILPWLLQDLGFFTSPLTFFPPFHEVGLHHYHFLVIFESERNQEKNGRNFIYMSEICPVARLDTPKELHQLIFAPFSKVILPWSWVPPWSLWLGKTQVTLQSHRIIIFSF